MNKTVKTVLLTVLACALVAGGILVGMSWERFGGGEPSSAPVDANTVEGADNVSRLQVDPNAGEYVPPEPAQPSEGDGIAIPGWGSITIPAGETEVAVDFPNSEANADKYDLSFELRLKDTGEVLYTSGLVPPGQTIQKITLSRALEAGTYAAVIHVQPYKMDEAQTATNNADMETVLVVVSQ